MANQKITDLNTLRSLDKDDLFIVVDRDSKSNSSSQTGETKQVTAENLATQLNNIANGETGIDLKNLRDVPNSYDDHKDGYIKINKEGTGIEFTESPGASERTFLFNQFDQSKAYNIGEILTIKENKLQHASCINTEDSEAIGIIKKIKTKLTELGNIEIESISVVFNGMIEWEYNPTTGDSGPISIETTGGQENPTTTLQNQVLIPGQTYFLGTNGNLIDFDPTESAVFDNYVSKPMLIANGPASGIVVNYRGLVCNQDEGVNKFVIPIDASCNSIKVGDILRIKRNKVRTTIDALNRPDYNETELEESVLPPFIGREGGTTNFALSNSASQNKLEGVDSPVEDDAYGCDMLGIVTNATTDNFEIQTSGMVEFRPPEYEVSSTQTSPISGLFLAGYTYYIESFPLNPDENASTNQTTQLRSSIYDYTPSDLAVKINSDLDTTSATPPLAQTLRTLMDGTNPFRNTTIVNPFERDMTTGQVVSYSKPAFYAVSETKILILNQTAYPNPKDRCNAIDPTTGTPCATVARESKSFSINRNNEFLNNSNIEQFSSDFLNSAWPTAKTNDEAIITFIFEITNTNGDTVDRFESYRMSKIVTGQNTNWALIGSA
nr:hypothetical protein [uncultured Mediterranean phage uvMED]